MNNTNDNYKISEKTMSDLVLTCDELLELFDHNPQAFMKCHQEMSKAMEALATRCLLLDSAIQKLSD